LGEPADWHGQADPVACGVVALDEVTLAAVEHWPPCDAPAVRVDPMQERPELIGEDPPHRPGVSGRRGAGGPFRQEFRVLRSGLFPDRLTTRTPPRRRRLTR